MSVTRVQLVGNVSTGASFAGIVTATSFIGALTGTATTTTNIPNLTGAITSNNTATSLGSFSSANLATALTDETGSGSNVFATSPTLVTPVLGAATATSVVVGSGVTINASGINAAAGIITATSFVGSGANLTGVISGVQIKSAGTSVGTGITNINFIGATATATGSASTITITVTASFNELDVSLFS